MITDSPICQFLMKSFHFDVQITEMFSLTLYSKIEVMDEHLLKRPFNEQDHSYLRIFQSHFEAKKLTHDFPTAKPLEYDKVSQESTLRLR